MPSEGHRAEQKIDALLGMIADNGTTPSGTVPSADYLAALRDVDPGKADAVRTAHAEGRAPPDVGGPERGSPQNV